MSVEPSFNSQRDGILQKPGAKRGKDNVVSIPNGMEFYPNVSGLHVAFLAFQFPTGWNSTVAVYSALF